MGCGINKGKFPKVYKSLQMIQLKTNNTQSPKYISQKSWINIIDFLNYAELKEVGKIILCLAPFCYILAGLRYVTVD